MEVWTIGWYMQGMETREIPLTAEERRAAHDWHGGGGSMMYAAATIGALHAGRLVPGMTEAEQWWDLTDRLMREARNAVSEAKRQNARGDISALLSIARKAEAASKAAEREVRGSSPRPDVLGHHHIALGMRRPRGVAVAS